MYHVMEFLGFENVIDFLKPQPVNAKTGWREVIRYNRIVGIDTPKNISMGWWIRQNCTDTVYCLSQYLWDDGNKDLYFFMNDEDMIAFKLRWL